MPTSHGVYEIRVGTIRFQIENGRITNRTVSDPLVVYVGKADNLSVNWNSYRGDPRAKGSRKERRLISDAMRGVFPSTYVDGFVRSFGVQVRWREVPAYFHGFFEAALLASYHYPWNLSDQADVVDDVED